MSDEGKSVDEIMVDEMRKTRETEAKVRKQWNQSVYVIANMIDEGLKQIPAHMLATICERHGYTLLDNGLSWSKLNK